MLLHVAFLFATKTLGENSQVQAFFRKSLPKGPSRTENTTG